MSLDYYGDDCFLMELDEKINGYVLSTGLTNKFTFVSYNDLYFKGDIKQYEVIISMRVALPQSTNWNTFRLVKTDNLGLYFISSAGDFNAYNIFLMRLPISEGTQITPTYEENIYYKPQEAIIPTQIIDGDNGVNDTLTLDPRIFYNTTPQTRIEVDRNTGIGSSNQTVMKFFLGKGLKGDKGQSQSVVASTEYFSSQYNLLWSKTRITTNGLTSIPITFNVPKSSITGNNRFLKLKIWLNYPDYIYTQNSNLKPKEGVLNTPALYMMAFNIQENKNVLEPLNNLFQNDNNGFIQDMTYKIEYTQQGNQILNQFIEIDLYEIETFIEMANLNDKLQLCFGVEILNSIIASQVDKYDFEISYELYSNETT